MTGDAVSFVGGRLREARDVQCWTLASLSKATSISSNALSAYERGLYDPPPARLDAIATALGFKIEFFFRPLAGPIMETQVVFERSRASTTKATRRRAEHKRGWMREVVNFLAQYLKMPTPDLPDFARDLQWGSLTDDDIERLAVETRRYWQLGDGPISNVTLLAENHGVVIAHISMESTLDAFSAWDVVDGRPYIVLGNDGQSACRVRSNVCHEMGHLILHQNLSRSEWEDAQTFKKVEKQAHRFASAFLTPATRVASDLRNPTLNRMRMVKPKWKASIKMLIHRAHELGFVGKDETARLYANYNRREWQHGEPYDSDWPVERPIMLKRAFEALDNSAIIDRHQIPAALPFNQPDIEQLAGLPAGYFNQDIWAFVGALTEDFPSASGQQERIAE